MKVYNYTDERTDVMVNVVALLVFGLPLFSVAVYSVIEYVQGKSDMSFDILLITTSLFLIGSLVFSYVGIANFINSRRNRKVAAEIMQCGQKIDGRIMEVKYERLSHERYKQSIFKRADFFNKSGVRIARGTKLLPYACVEYDDIIIETTYLGFNPRYLKSNAVKVYVYGDKVYVGDFDIDAETMAKKRRSKKSVNLYSVLGFFIAIAICILVFYLSSLGFIDDELAMPICMTVMVVFAVSTTIVSLKSQFTNNGDSDGAVKISSILSENNKHDDTDSYDDVDDADNQN